MTYRVEFRPAAYRSLRKLDPFIRRKIVEDIENLAENPRPHGVEKLETRNKLYRVCIGPRKDYRVIYEIYDERLLVLVINLGNRKDIYRA